jgi:opacity protein-like surface antigen
MTKLHRERKILRLSLAGMAAAGLFSLTATGALAQGDDYRSRDRGYDSGLDAYVEPRAGVAFFDTDLPNDVLDTDTDAGYSVGAALGLTSPTSGIRGEAEFLYQRAGFELGPDDDHVSAMTLMANGYYDFDTGGPVQPFVGAGVGVARVGAEIAGIADDDDWVVAYNAQTGLSANLNTGGQLTAGYRYTGYGDAAIAGFVGDFETQSHAIHLGYRHGF